MTSILQHIIAGCRENKKFLAHLIDPDKFTDTDKNTWLTIYRKGQPDFIFYGGSLVVGGYFEEGILWLKQQFPDIPVIIFPGDSNQLSKHADAILLLSLVSGRNPELLIGKHVGSSFALKRLGIEILSTAYHLVESGHQTTANYMSFSAAIPPNKPEIAAATALAAEQLGMQLAYFDCGSGAENSLSTSFISTVSEYISIPKIVGGGIKSAEQANRLWKAGADILVVGNQLEKQPELLPELLKAKP
ncbi:MAG: geranylgeranylglyceryl/heptaprenylglyceryl phosphate synthase [Luteibaculaceae bacterium]